MILEFALGLSFVAAEAFAPGVAAEAFSSDFVPEALAADIVPIALDSDVAAEAFVPDAASVIITITPAPMSVSPVAASRIYPLTVHLFWAARLTAKMTAIAANVIFRTKEYLFEDSLASNPFHYNQSTLSPHPSIQRCNSHKYCCICTHISRYCCLRLQIYIGYNKIFGKRGHLG